MADLLASLIVPPSPRSSEDSFRSLASQPRAEAAASSPADPSSSMPISSAVSASAFEAAGLPVYDIDSYLTKNAGASAAAANKAPKTHTFAANDPPEPVPLVSKTSFSIGALNTQCQSKGFSPIFEINGTPDFGGFLRLRDVTVTSDRRWPSKKEAREDLAEKGLEIVKGMEARRKEPGDPQMPASNWIGMLLEYHNSRKEKLEPIEYQEYALGSHFTCTCNVPSLPNQVFGSKLRGFTAKKDAKANAAKEAVEFLISQGELNPDGSSKARKKAKLDSAVRIQGTRLEVKKETTYSQKVNDMCPVLGLSSPYYHLGPVSESAPNMLSGYATFPNAPNLPAEIGEVRHVFGKKKAREEIAKGVWQVLTALAAQRGVIVDEIDHDAVGVEDREMDAP